MPGCVSNHLVLEIDSFVFIKKKNSKQYIHSISVMGALFMTLLIGFGDILAGKKWVHNLVPVPIH